MWRAFSRSRQASTPRRRCHGLTEETGSWEGTPGDDPKLVLDDPPPRHQQIPWDRLAVAGHTDRQATQAVGIGRRRAHFGAVSVFSQSQIVEPAAAQVESNVQHGGGPPW